MKLATQLNPILSAATLALTLAGCAARAPEQATPPPSVERPQIAPTNAIPSLAPTALAPAPTVAPTSSELIVDSELTLDEALAGKKFPLSIRKTLALVEVPYLGFDGSDHQGQLVVHQDLADDVRAIFADLRAADFPIEKMIPVNKYDWSDGDSMADNNTSAFNYRVVAGRGGLSQHALGRAIDLNPLLNPCIRDGKSYPRQARWNVAVKGTITQGVVVEAFTKRGWQWGGNWRNSNIVDYQHFEKLAPGTVPRFS